MSVPTPAQIQYMEEHINDSMVPNLIAANVICAVVSLAAIIVRFIARRLIRLPLKLDDWLIVLAWIFSTGFGVGWMALIPYGGGRHVIVVTQPKTVTEIFLSITCFYVASIVAIKISILCLYARLFPQRWFMIANRAVGVFVICWGITYEFINIFQCVPIRSLWDPTVKGRCLNYGSTSLSASLLNVATDFVILALPLPLIWKLQIAKDKKWALTGTFAIGCSACIVSIIRLAYIQSVGSTFDITWNDVQPALLSTAELCIGIIAACLPTYRAFIKHANGTTRPGTRTNNSYNTYPLVSGTHTGKFSRKVTDDRSDLSKDTLALGNETWVRVEEDERGLVRGR